MASTVERHARKEVRLLLKKINNAWLKGRPDKLSDVPKDCFHKDVVIKGPGFQQLAEGNDACTKSYNDFIHQATVRECKLSEPDIDLWGNTAVATYSWEMTYEMNGQDHHESGYDLFVFARARGRWRAVWRAMLPSVQ